MKPIRQKAAVTAKKMSNMMQKKFCISRLKILFLKKARLVVLVIYYLVLHL